MADRQACRGVPLIPSRQAASTGFGAAAGRGSLRSAPRLQVLAQERARMGERASSRLEARVPQRPRMDHMRPDFEGHRDVGLAGDSG
jgi:hypothetical protein